MKPLNHKQVERILKNAKFWHDRTSGSHFIWENAEGRSVPVPHHGNQPLPQGTLLSIFKLAGLQPPR
ncbi:MAG: type II toxin-antitoxin system HicA family toxin [Kiritimatiellae bacterium]|jgi:predicted RNA binding protein YcfA (HicA-like mRNA interferase family)|nr:type II toxin-antitoxin system HicA family toxin [Kiritimatiellia bacterium]